MEHREIVPTLRVGMHPVTLCVTVDAERPWRHSHAERGNDRCGIREYWNSRLRSGPGSSD
ncbi:hypothetical protein FGA82_22910 [Pseudomonas fluorescens]|nr:hypothetical protein FGA82_22910 [Pseudomonas fluorescens]